MIRYVHTNLVAKNWRRLAKFYVDVLGCEPVYPERDLAGRWLDKATGVDNVQIRGIHLRLPGYGDSGPTLELFTYDPGLSSQPTAANRPGWGHLAFAVQDVAETAARIRDAGGRDIGRLTRVEVDGVGWLTFQYLADPEGNIIEIQKLEGGPS